MWQCEKYGGVPPFTETQNYVAKVTSLMQTGVSVPANTVTVNPSANTSSNTGTATSENFNTSMKQLFLPKQQKKCGNPRRDQRDHLCHFHTHNEPKHVFKYIHAEWSFRIKRNIRFRFQCRQPAFSYGNPISTILSSLQNVDTTDTESLQKYYPTRSTSYSPATTRTWLISSPYSEVLV